MYLWTQTERTRNRCNYKQQYKDPQQLFLCKKQNCSWRWIYFIYLGYFSFNVGIFWKIWMLQVTLNSVANFYLQILPALPDIVSCRQRAHPQWLTPLTNWLWCYFLKCSCIYLEYVGDNCIVMFVLLLVELLQVGGVIALTVGSHLVLYLSRLSCLEKERITHTNMLIRQTLCLLKISVCPTLTQTWVKHMNSQSTQILVGQICAYRSTHACTCTVLNMATSNQLQMGQNKEDKSLQWLQDGEIWISMLSQSGLFTVAGVDSFKLV